MENAPKFILGTILIVLCIIWFYHKRKKLIAETKNKDYKLMSYTIESLLCAFIFLIIGIRLIYDSL